MATEFQQEQTTLQSSPEQHDKSDRFHWYNFNWQTANYGVSGVFVILFWVYLARMWPQATFGQFSILFVWMGIYSLVTDLGMDFWVTRKTAIDKENAYERHVVAFKFISSIAIAVGFVIAAWWAGLPMTAFLVFLLGTFILNITNFYSCYLRGCEKLSVEAKISVVRHLSFMFVASLGVYQGADLIWVAASYTFSTILAGILTCLALKNSDFRLIASQTEISKILHSALGVWITFVLIGLSIKLDILMVGALLNEEAVAIYSAAARIFEGGVLLATAFVLTLFPALSKTSEHQPQQYFAQVVKHGKLLLGLSVIAAIIGIIAAQWFFVLMYGQDYEKSGELFVYMMLIFPLTSLIYYLYNALVIAGMSKQVILVLSATLLLNLALDFLLIPIWHVDGAIFSYATREVVLIASLVVLLYQYKSKNQSVAGASEEVGHDNK